MENKRLSLKIYALLNMSLVGRWVMYRGQAVNERIK